MSSVLVYSVGADSDAGVGHMWWWRSATTAPSPSSNGLSYLDALRVLDSIVFNA
jgi:hypothetical protein